MIMTMLSAFICAANLGMFAILGHTLVLLHRPDLNEWMQERVFQIIKETEKPNAKLDEIFLKRLSENKKLPWFIRQDGSNISPLVRNVALAEALKDGNRNLEKIAILARMANLNEEVLLPGDKPREQSWWARIRSEKPRGYVPLERAQQRSDPAIIKIIEEQRNAKRDNK